MDLDERWNGLREALDQDPGELAFRAVIGILDTCPGDEVEDAIAYVRQGLDSWPDEFRVAPWTWFCALAGGKCKPSLALVQTLRSSSGHHGCDPISLASLPDRPPEWSITRLELSEFAEKSCGAIRRNDLAAHR